MTPSTHIKHISIEGLWNRYDVEWTLHPDVNILIGENGSGKSTILALLNMFLNNIIVEKDIVTSNSILTLENGEKHKFDATEEAGHFADAGQIIVGITRGRDLDYPFQTDFINTGEKEILTKEDYQKNKEPYIKTFLDYELKNIINKYVKYERNQYKKAANKEISLEKSLEKKNYLVETINRCFAHTGKKLDNTNNDFDLGFTIDEEYINPYQLSSGEKQFLILLLTVLCQDEKPYILLLDEPEISLHIRWQHELIEILRTLNPNCQLIIATHSTSVFTKGWRDKIFDMLEGEHGRNPILKLAKKDNP